MIKLFLHGEVPADKLRAFLQHIRDFDTANDGCHFEIVMDDDNEATTMEEMVERLRVNPELTFQKIFERNRKE